MVMGMTTMIGMGVMIILVMAGVPLRVTGRGSDTSASLLFMVVWPGSRMFMTGKQIAGQKRYNQHDSEKLT